jgi:hypothetical protein
VTTYWCPACDTLWPKHDDFLSCPRDGRETRTLDDAEPEMTLAKAKPIAQSYRDFEKFYAKRGEAA